MKKLILLLTVILLSTSCKKKIDVESEKTFYEINVPPPSDSIFNSAMSVTLFPDGKADILPVGDVVERGTYKLYYNKLVVMIASKKYEFLILSNNQIKYGKDRILEVK